MKIFDRTRKAAALFGALLLLLGALAILLPHAHHGTDPHCAACEILELHRTLFAHSLSYSVIAILPLFLLLLTTAHALRQSRDRTPVGLKVKLSD